MCWMIGACLTLSSTNNGVKDNFNKSRKINWNAYSIIHYFIFFFIMFPTGGQILVKSMFWIPAVWLQMQNDPLWKLHRKCSSSSYILYPPMLQVASHSVQGQGTRKMMKDECTKIRSNRTKKSLLEVIAWTIRWQATPRISKRKHKKISR